jgi:hypothetical protein
VRDSTGPRGGSPGLPGGAPWTARLLGYQRPIAHGMWTLAHALELLGRRDPLEPPFDVDASFKRPLFLPGRSIHRAAHTPDGPIHFEVRDAESGAPQLIGTARPR